MLTTMIRIMITNIIRIMINNVAREFRQRSMTVPSLEGCAPNAYPW